MRFGFAVRGIAVMVCSERRRMGSLVLLDLLGGVALLLWGLHMVLSGVLRAFGSNLRRFSAKLSATASPLLAPASSLPRSCGAARRPD
jgi:hypothetical protein